MPAVATGLEVLCREQLSLCRGKRVGVLCHPASVDDDLVHIVDRLMACGVRPTRLFGPEHGVRGEAQDMIGVSSEVDRRTGVPITSLYGDTLESLAPPVELLEQVDLLLVDLQDVGSRYYTYVWTMALGLEAASRAGIEVVVLDRPNPLGGVEVEGSTPDPALESFVGLAAVSIRHGMTIGELAMLLKAGLPWGGPRFARPLDCKLTVLPMRGWKRPLAFEATELPWVLPSPNMPSVDTAWVYPGMCLLEGTNLSEGRGTTRPFEIIGAPFLDGFQLAQALEQERLPGVRFRPLSFRPTFHKFAGQSCGGVQVHVTDRNAFRPFRTGVAVLLAASRIASGSFRWRTEPYEFVSNHLAIDLLTGDDSVRRGVDDGRSLAELVADWTPAENAFRERRLPHLLYT